MGYLGTRTCFLWSSKELLPFSQQLSWRSLLASLSSLAILFNIKWVYVNWSICYYVHICTTVTSAYYVDLWCLDQQEGRKPTFCISHHLLTSPQTAWLFLRLFYIERVAIALQVYGAASGSPHDAASACIVCLAKIMWFCMAHESP